MLRKKKQPAPAVEEQMPAVVDEEYRRLEDELRAAEAGAREASEAYVRAADELKEKGNDPASVTVIGLEDRVERAKAALKEARSS